uniref:Uncharacterized protein n=1 Tax=Oryza nivara TaxID=4536 RepID=A0A0E0HC46_ORYNI
MALIITAPDKVPTGREGPNPSSQIPLSRSHFSPATSERNDGEDGDDGSASWCARAVTTAEQLLLCRLGGGGTPEGAQSRATVLAVRLGGRANGDERRVAWTSLAGGTTPSRHFQSTARDSGGVIQDSTRTGNPTRLQGGEGVAVPLPGKLR